MGFDGALANLVGGKGADPNWQKIKDRFTATGGSMNAGDYQSENFEPPATPTIAPDAKVARSPDVARVDDEEEDPTATKKPSASKYLSPGRATTNSRSLLG